MTAPLLRPNPEAEPPTRLFQQHVALVLNPAIRQGQLEPPEADGTGGGIVTGNDQQVLANQIFGP